MQIKTDTNSNFVLLQAHSDFLLLMNLISIYSIVVTQRQVSVKAAC